MKESASNDSRSPEDLRFPPERVVTTGASTYETPTITADSPRQTQYAYRNIDLVAREARSVRSLFPEAGQPPSQLHGIFNADSWTGGATNSGPTGLNPLINNNINVNGFDTDMSDGQNASTGLTPQSSYSYNQSSSNTSYSPPMLQDEDPGTSQATGPIPGYAAFPPSSENVYNGQQNSNSASTRSPMNDDFQAYGNNNNSQLPNRPRHQQQTDPFKNMQSWEKLSSSPGPFQGMSPGEGWEKMMSTLNENMGFGG